MAIAWDTQEVELNSWSNSDGDWDTPVALAAFPFAAGWPYVLEIQAGQSGYTVSVNGIEQTSFDYQYDPATVDTVRASGAHRCRVQYGSGDSVDDADGAYTCTDDVFCFRGARAALLQMLGALISCMIHIIRSSGRCASDNDSQETRARTVRRQQPFADRLAECAIGSQRTFCTADMSVPPPRFSTSTSRTKHFLHRIHPGVSGACGPILTRC